MAALTLIARGEAHEVASPAFGQAPRKILLRGNRSWCARLPPAGSRPGRTRPSSSRGAARGRVPRAGWQSSPAARGPDPPSRSARQCHPHTRLEAHLGQRLGLQFTETMPPVRGKRPIREIIGVNTELNTRWSSRRQAIEARTAELSKQFQAEHGREPTNVEAIALAQQATLQSREAKHEPRCLPSSARPGAPKPSKPSAAATS